MNKILFPGLNLSFEIPQIAINIWNFQIYWYAVIIVFAMILSLLLMYFTKKKYNIKYDELLEILIFTFIFGIIGARCFYVVFNFKYYIANPLQIFNIRNGGLAIYGGIIAGAITAYVVCRKKKIQFLNFCDYVVPYLALSQAIGRLGNFINVEAYGIPTNSMFRMGIFIDNGYIEVHPCFLYEMIGCFTIFIILKLLQKNQKYQGEILNFYMILYGVVRFVIEGLRADSLMLYNFKISQIISLIFVVLGIILYINNIFCRKKPKNVDEK